MFEVIGLVVVFVLMAILSHLDNKPKPFVERDKDGYLTPESYRSHITYHPYGGVEVDTWAITQTRQFAEMMKLSKQIHESGKPLIIQD